MPERKGQLAKKLGFVPTYEAVKQAQEEAEKAARKAKIETIRSLLLGRSSQYGQHSFLTDKTLVTVWNKREGEGKLAWLIIRDLLINLHSLGAEIVGINPRNGEPEVVCFDPEQHGIYNRGPLTNPTEEEITKHDKEMSRLTGKKARVVVPGITVEGEVILYPKVEFIKEEQV